MTKKNEIEVTYTRSNLSDEAAQNILANALKPVFEKVEEMYRNNQEKPEKGNKD